MIYMSCSRTQLSDTGEAQTRGPSVSSQALYHWATALPSFLGWTSTKQRIKCYAQGNNMATPLTIGLEPATPLSPVLGSTNWATAYSLHFLWKSKYMHLQNDMPLKFWSIRKELENFF